MSVIPAGAPFGGHKDSIPVPLSFSDMGVDVPETPVLRVPSFILDSVQYVLVKDLARLWNFPSSYQVVAKLVKRAGVPRASVEKTTPETNQFLVDNGVISAIDAKYSLQYIAVSEVIGRLSDPAVLVWVEVKEDPVLVVNGVSDDDKITVGQIFPQYGNVDSTLELKHSSFNALTNLTKFNYYKATSNTKFLGPTKMFPSEIETLYNNNDHGKVELDEAESSQRRKPAKGRKSNVHIDPNNLDLSESVLPGQGFIQEFNINHVCKIPNYYITNSQYQPSTSVSSASPSVSSSTVNLAKKGDAKMSRNVSQLATGDHDGFNVSKYFYSKTYRGPGSGNYKDAALVNRINKIPTEPKRLVTNVHRRNINPKHPRTNLHLKGLVQEKFNKPYIDYVLNAQRQYVEDFDNMEMLHNTLQFNLLTNTYRGISERTWVNYFKFKNIDFDQAIMSKVDTSRNVLYNRFSLPTNYPEIMRHLPVEFREKDHHSLIKNPLYFNVQYPDGNNPQLLTNVEIIKLPNANELAWDNIKKYKSA